MSWRTTVFLAIAVGILVLIVLGISLFAPNQSGQLRTTASWNSDYARSSLASRNELGSDAEESPTFGAASESLSPFSFATVFDRAAALGANNGDPLAELYGYLNTFNNVGGNAGGGANANFEQLSFAIGDPKSSAPTPEQRQLHEYGNNAAAGIAALDALKSDSNARLAAFLENPNNATAEGVRIVVSRLRNAGTGIVAAGEPPVSISIQMQALESGYASTANALAELADAQGEQGILIAVDTYTAAVGELGGAFVAVVNAFSKAGVQFEANEAGSIFSFGGGI